MSDIKQYFVSASQPQCCEDKDKDNQNKITNKPVCNRTINDALVNFSREQQIVFNKYVKGENIFITGPGGTGKSLLIQHIYKHATITNNCNISITALTGCAALLLNCNAKTIHSWGGIGIGTGTVETIVKNIKKRKNAISLWHKTDILVVDEVSMLSLKLFNLLNKIGQTIRKNVRPFGGIQVIFSGDFFQLPPVGGDDDLETKQFCFESDDWNNVFKLENQIQLVSIFRQTDITYSTILNNIRRGIIKKKNNELLLKYVGRIKPAELIVDPTKIFPTKNKVETINTQKLRELLTDEYLFTTKRCSDLEIATKSEKMCRAQFTSTDIEYELNYLECNLRCDKSIKLKIGAQVMCIINVINMESDENELLLCNGSQGIVTSFNEINGFPVIKYANGYEATMTPHMWVSEKIPGVGIFQVPLVLSWAMTIHKSQGATLSVAEIDIGSGIFECGQTYVALSRVKSLDGLYLTSYDFTKIRINSKVKKYYLELDEFSLKLK